MNFPKYFTLSEVLKTSQPFRNFPTDWEQVHNLLFCTLALDVVRDRFGHPLRVNSGFRTREVNRAVGGVATSQHLLGCAFDVRPVDVTLLDDFNFVCKGFVERKETVEGLGIDQLIIYPTFVHIGWSRNPRWQVITKK